MAGAGEPAVGGYAHYQAIADEQGFYLFNFHKGLLLVILV